MTKKSIYLLLLVFLSFAFVHAQKQNSIDIGTPGEMVTGDTNTSVSGIWYSTQPDVIKVVVTEFSDQLFVKWYFTNGNVNTFVLKKIDIPSGEKARSEALSHNESVSRTLESIDFRGKKQQVPGFTKIYEYRYGEEGRYVGTILMSNSSVVEIDEDQSDEHYYARYEWSR